MQIHMILVLTLAVSFCNSTWNNNYRRNLNSKKERKKLAVSRTYGVDIDLNVKEDAHLSTTKLIAKYGYPVEIHRIITEDGYILELHRIPRPGAVPVLMVHGLLDSSAAWVLMGPDKGFAYLLYNLGYDVWMANCRGNTYSKKHVNLDPKKDAFWEFTFHEIGIYDIPATIDYILQTTYYRKLHYIGHSQGGSCFFIMCSLRPEYNQKIISMQGLAPAAFIGSSTSPAVEVLSYFQDQIYNIFESIGSCEILPTNQFIQSFSRKRCKDGTTTQQLCSNILFFLSGFDMDQINATMLPVILGHYPAGSSIRQILHFGQSKKSRGFRQFNFGKTINLQKYGRTTPPAYDLKRVTAKVAIHYGANDLLVVPRDIDILSQALPNVVAKHLVHYPYFNHMDFLYAIDARELVYNKVTMLMKAIEYGNL